jgi:uncharacterized protein HemX/uroporphyrinogen-III synthase
VVTRPAGQAGPLASLIEASGGRALRFPAIEIQDIEGWSAPELAGFDLAVFVSPTAAHKALEKIAAWPPGLRAAAVGRGTQRELERRGVGEVLAPDAGADSEALLALPELQDMAGKRVVVFRGQGGRELLGETLSARGAQVEYAECYRRARPQADAAPLLAAWERGEVDAVTVSSAEGLDNFLALLGERGRQLLERTPLFATHARVASHARSLGIQEAIVGGPGDDELHAQLMAYFAPRMSDAPPQRKSKAPLLLAVAIVLAAALAAAFWLDARNRIDATQQELARRLRDIENDAREARSVARQSQEALREAQAKVGQLEARLAESQSQQLALEALYQDLSRNRDEWQLAEIEQVLAIASQQLQLAGNVRAALLALQLAEARLARADRPQFLPIRRALARDIERLKSLPALDLAGMSMRLDSLVAQVDSLPLAFDERGERIGAPKEAAPAAGERGFWSRLGAEVWSELRQLVVVRQVNDPEPPLLPPSQAYFLRENLRLRLLNARLTLLTRDEAGYREDLRVAQAWIQRYFDPQSRQAREMLAQLKQLSSTTLSFEMPTISESLDAVRGFKSRKERTP